GRVGAHVAAGRPPPGEQGRGAKTAGEPAHRAHAGGHAGARAAAHPGKRFGAGAAPGRDRDAGSAGMPALFVPAGGQVSGMEAARPELLAARAGGRVTRHERRSPDERSDIRGGSRMSLRSCGLRRPRAAPYLNAAGPGKSSIIARPPPSRGHALPSLRSKTEKPYSTLMPISRASFPYFS